MLLKQNTVEHFSKEELVSVDRNMLRMALIGQRLTLRTIKTV
jgi:hypothetical protein